MLVEEAPPPRKRKTSKQALFEALGGTCQVAPDKKELLGAAEELETSEEQCNLRPALPPPRSLPYKDVNSETFVAPRRAMRAETEMQVAPPVCEATLQVVVAVDGPAPPRSLWSRTLVSLRGMRTEAKTADWCAVWAGLLCFLALLPLVLTVTDDEQARYRVPQPMKWGSDPFEAWDWYNGCFTWLLLALLLAIYLLCAQLTGKLRKLPTSRYVVGFCAHGLLATLCLWLGRNKTLAPFGISYAVYAIFLGMLVGNVASLSPQLEAVVEKWLQPVAKDGEFMIKIALVLYAKSYRIIGQVGPP